MTESDGALGVVVEPDSILPQRLSLEKQLSDEGRKLLAQGLSGDGGGKEELRAELRAGDECGITIRSMAGDILLTMVLPESSTISELTAQARKEHGMPAGGAFVIATDGLQLGPQLRLQDLPLPGSGVDVGESGAMRRLELLWVAASMAAPHYATGERVEAQKNGVFYPCTISEVVPAEDGWLYVVDWDDVRRFYDREKCADEIRPLEPAFRKKHWSPADGYDDAHMMKGAFVGAAAGYALTRPVGLVIGAIGGRDASASAGGATGVIGGMIGGVAGGIVGGVVEGVVVGGKTVANEVGVTAQLGRAHIPARGSYRFGDFTRGIAAKGRLARGGDVEGYRWDRWDFTRGLFTASNSQAVRDGYRAERQSRLSHAAAHA